MDEFQVERVIHNHTEISLHATATFMKLNRFNHKLPIYVLTGVQLGSEYG